MLRPRLSFFGIGGSNNVNNSSDGLKSELAPTIKLQTEKDVYRPGDSIFVTIEISNPSNGALESSPCSLLIEKLGFEIKGIEKLDPQWFATQKPLPGSRQRRGEHVFLDCSTSSMVSNQILSSGATKTCKLRFWHYLEARVPLQIWVTQQSNGLLMEDQIDGIVPATTLLLDLYWKPMDGDSEWARANDDNGLEEGYDSSRDEISSVSSYNPAKESIHKTFGSSLSLHSFTARSSNASHIEGGRTSLSTLAPPRLSVAEVLYASGADISSPDKSASIVSSSQQQKIVKPHSEDDIVAESSPGGVGVSEPATSEGFLRGKSYNIRMDNQVLLRFSPKNSDSTYYFSDMIGGTLTFFHEEGSRRCLEVSITLETSETVSRRFVHPSRKNSPTITKVQSDHHEVVADLVQTGFLFSVPMDGPMSFSTPHVSVQWVLRFEFFTTPKNVDWTRYEHPLLVEGRDKSEWVLPITVHAPPSGTLGAHTRNEKHFSLEPLWIHT
uniref:Reduced growth phenotype protein 1 n=1 Tax=Manihot esculenta TaxID=3983 RepID=A0A2C9V069_MANES